MSPRTGRPKIENPKSVDVKVRFDEPLHNKLMAYCQQHGITRAEGIREAVVQMLAEK